MRIAYLNHENSLPKPRIGKYCIFPRDDGGATYTEIKTPKQLYVAQKYENNIINMAIKRIIHYRIAPHPMLQPVTEKLLKPRGTNKTSMEHQIKKISGFDAKIK